MRENQRVQIFLATGEIKAQITSEDAINFDLHKLAQEELWDVKRQKL